MAVALSGRLDGDKLLLALALWSNLPSQGSAIKAILCPEPFDRAALDFAGQVDDDEIERFLFGRGCPDGVLCSAVGPVPHQEGIRTARIQSGQTCHGPDLL